MLPLKPVCQNEIDPSLGVAIADALTTRLCNLKFVKVMPTSTVLRLIEPCQNPWLAAHDLAIDALLDGLYQRDGERLRVSIQLIRVGKARCFGPRSSTPSLQITSHFKTQFQNRSRLRSLKNSIAWNRRGSQL